MSTNTRRVYLSSNDSTEEYNENTAMKIDMRGANIGCKPNEYLSVSLVRASLPTTLTPGGLTTQEYLNPASPAQNDNPPDQVQIVSWLYPAVGGTEYHLIFNDLQGLNSGLANSRIAYWTATTDMGDILYEMNQLMGAEVLGIQVGSTGELRRIQVTESTYSVKFLSGKTTNKIAQALGIYEEIDTIVQNRPAPYQYNTSAVGTDVYVRTNLGFDSFISFQGGQNDNILAGIPLVVSNSAVGLKLQSQTISSASGVVSNSETLDTMINYTNHALSGSHKPISQNKVGEIFLELIDNRGVAIGTGVSTWDVVLEFKRVRVD